MVNKKERSSSKKIARTKNVVSIKLGVKQAKYMLFIIVGILVIFVFDFFLQMLYKAKVVALVNGRMITKNKLEKSLIKS